MSLVLNNLQECPPGYFKYFVSETGRWIPDPQLDKGRHYLSMPDLLTDLTKHYTANGLAVPSELSKKVQDQMCRTLPPERCRYGSDSDKPVARFLMTFAQIVEGTTNLVKWDLKGRVKASPEISNERSAVCVRCPLNVNPSGCATCNSPLNALVNSFVGSRKGAYDSQLQACAVCGCGLKVLVQMPQETIAEHLSPEQKEALPEYCWQK